MSGWLRPMRVTIGRQRIWNALRVMKSGSVFEIAYAAQTDTRDTARYLNLLHRAGYLSRHPPRFRGGGKVWRIERRTGPRRPVHRPAEKCVFDPNEHRCYSLLSPTQGQQG